MSFFKALVPVFELASDAPCLRVPDAPDISYQALHRQIILISANLHARGVAAGDRVLVQSPKCPELIALYLATLRIGAIYVPLNDAYTRYEVEYFLNDAEPTLFVAENADSGVRLSSLMQTGLEDPGVCSRSTTDPAAIVYTSGTTGRSKGAVLSHGNLLSNASALSGLWGWRESDVLLHALPVFHVHGLFVALHCALLNGTPIVFLPKFNAEQVLAQLDKVTVMMGVPTFYTRLLADPEFTRASCTSVRLFISGSAPLTELTFADFYQRTGHKILERYGMSETLMISSNPLDGDRIPGTVGFALPKVTIRVRDDQGELAAPDVVGEIEVKGPNVMTQYWRMPEKTAAEFTTDGFLKTGDLGTIDATGRLALVGRSKDLIISGGYNVYPKEVEAVLDALPGVVETAVIGVPHPDFGEGVVAVIVAEAAGIAPESSELEAWLAGRLARFKQPKVVFFAEQLPRNAMGKVQKAQLREMYRDVFL